MAGKLSCLQLFPPFIYLFFFTVLNITSLSLLLEAKRFQCVGLRFRLFKEPSWRKDFIPQPAGPQEGVSWMEGEECFYHWDMFAVLCRLHPAAAPSLPVWLGADNPIRAPSGCCSEHHVELELGFRDALLPCCASPQFNLVAPGDVWLATALAILAAHRGTDCVSVSLFPAGGDRTGTRPGALWSRSNKRDCWDRALFLRGSDKHSLPSSWRAIYWVLKPLNTVLFLC